jgi:hypothetical protein
MATFTPPEQAIRTRFNSFIGLFLEELFDKNSYFDISVVAVKANDDPSNLTLKIASLIYDQNTFAHIEKSLLTTLCNDHAALSRPDRGLARADIFFSSLNKPFSPDEVDQVLKDLTDDTPYYISLYYKAIKRLCVSASQTANQLFFDLPHIDHDGYYYYPIFSIAEDWIAKYTPVVSPPEINNNFLNCLIEQLAYHFRRANLQSYGDLGYNVQGVENTDTLTLYQLAASDFIWQLSNNSKIEAMGLYANLNSIALERYETKDCEARIALCTPFYYDEISPVFELKNPVQLKEYRKVRKLLEIVDTDNALLSDGVEIKGIADCSQLKFIPKEDAFYINFLGYANWEITRTDDSESLLLQYKAGAISTVSHKMSDAKIVESIERGGTPGKTAYLKSLPILKAIRDSKHGGSILVFIDTAQQEAERLKLESFLVKPFELDPKNIPLYTKMDGALLIDMECNCYALGVILDGEATDKADSSRGSRYNSAYRYYQYYKKEFPDKNCLIAVVSDDGMMDIFC